MPGSLTKITDGEDMVAYTSPERIGEENSSEADEIDNRRQGQESDLSFVVPEEWVWDVNSPDSPNSPITIVSAMRNHPNLVHNTSHKVGISTKIEDFDWGNSKYGCTLGIHVRYLFRHQDHNRNFWDMRLSKSGAQNFGWNHGVGHYKCLQDMARAELGDRESTRTVGINL